MRCRLITTAIGCPRSTLIVCMASMWAYEWLSYFQPSTSYTHNKKTTPALWNRAKMWTIPKIHMSLFCVFVRLQPCLPNVYPNPSLMWYRSEQSLTFKHRRARSSYLIRTITCSLRVRVLKVNGTLKFASFLRLMNSIDDLSFYRLCHQEWIHIDFSLLVCGVQRSLIPLFG